jgi:hypothetical protein
VFTLESSGTALSRVAVDVAYDVYNFIDRVLAVARYWQARGCYLRESSRM